MQVMMCKMLEIDPPEFAHLPIILQASARSAKDIPLKNEPTLNQMIDKGFFPEAILNNVALLGWNPPHREDPTIVSSAMKVFMKHEMLTKKDLVGLFNLDKVQKQGVPYMYENMVLINQFHLRHRFTYFDTLEQKRCVQSFRKMFIEVVEGGSVNQ